MIIAIVLGLGAMFALGYALGDEAGWDRCWKALTKDDRWREEADKGRAAISGEGERR